MAYTYLMTPDELRAWREQNGYSQSKLATMLKVDVMTVSRWERGVRDIPSFLHLALGYLELRGGERLEKGTRERKRKGR